LQQVPLYEIYSEELNNAKQEYILAISEQKNFSKAIVKVDEIVQAAVNKLLLWGLSKANPRFRANKKTIKYYNILQSNLAI
jgi:Cu(I)/Ag(I) efflux system membrane fusion protein